MSWWGWLGIWFFVWTIIAGIISWLFDLEGDEGFSLFISFFIVLIISAIVHS